MHKLSFLFAMAILLWSCQEDNNQVVKTEDHQESESETNTSGYNETKNAYFGDLHVHTSWSFDAFIYSIRTNPEDAYRYAMGEEINHVNNQKIKISKPLDFMAVSDHSEYLGVMKQMIEPDNPLFDFPIAKQIRSENSTASFKAFSQIGLSIARNEAIPEFALQDQIQNTWNRVVEAADKFYAPGKFTTFPAYEWTSSISNPVADVPYAANMHRNVIYKTSNVSERPFSSFDSQNPEDLWRWMDKERSKGIELIAIPHNGNMSNGLMYANTTFEGDAFTPEYAQARTRNEPLSEVIQLKGQSMSHPSLSPNDEFANFELSEYTFSVEGIAPSQAPNSYVREALSSGLAHEKSIGENPFQFGLIGSSDGHNSAGAYNEANHFGKSGIKDNSPELRLATETKFLLNKDMGGAGLAGVWATENTRESIFSSLQNKETFATSGPRIQVRFFCTGSVDDSVFEKDDWVAKSYKNGQPMGSKFTGFKGDPTFLVWASKDPDDGNLDRVQIIKQWIDDDNNHNEKIINVDWSDERELDKLGKLPALKSTVDIENASYTNDIGKVILKGVWTDEDFNPNQYALYFVRVLQIPTPRWSTYDANALGFEVLKDKPAVIQERAWSSPIWFSPK